MLAAIVAAALRLRPIMFLALGLLIAGSLTAANNLDVEAYPNPIPPMIEILAQPTGLGAEEVEKYVTIPLETTLAAMPNLEKVRSQSLFGLSDIKCYFRWGTDYATARQETINRLTFATLPPGVKAVISPWNAIGEIYRYTLEGKGYSLLELKTAQDFVMERQLRQVPGVADVTSFGGETRQYQVRVDPLRLRSMDLSLSQLVDAIQNANESVGGQRIAIGAQSYDVRGVGLIRNVEDIENIVLAYRPSEVGSSKLPIPIRIRDVAFVTIGPAPRLGIVGIQDRPDVVQGIVLMRWNATTRDTLGGVRDRVSRIRNEHLLPPGMEVIPYYDRGDLVATTTHTVRENVIVGMILVAVVLVVFLGNVRAALITALTVPLSLGCAIIGLVLSQTSANLLSLGAIDFGIVVDSSVVMMDGIYRRLGRGAGEGASDGIAGRIRLAARDVGGPMAFSTLIIGVSFLPLFTMTGVAGVVFGPMAKTYAFAIGGAILLALTTLPALASKLLASTLDRHAPDDDSALMRRLRRIYKPVFAFALAHPWRGLVLACLPMVAALLLLPGLGGEFMPELEEGNLYIRATLPISISREGAAGYADRMRAIVRGCPKPPARCDASTQRHPDILTALSQVGRPDDGTDVTGFNDIEVFAPLADLRESPRTKADIVRALDTELTAAFPGVVFAYSQMISDNVEEAVAGVKGANSIKVFGTELDSDEAIAHRIVSILSRVGGISDLGSYASLGQPTIRVTPDREAAGRYGVNAGDVVAMVQAAIGGQAVTRVYEGEKWFDLTIRWIASERSSLAAVGRVLVATPDGAQVPLSELARIETVSGAATVYREDGERYVPVKFSVRGRDLAGAIADAQAAVAREIKLPWGAHLTWAGQLGELRRAEMRLAIIVPVTLVLIAAIAYIAVRRARDTAIVVANVPIAAAGGVIALWLTGTHLSVAAAMGFVSVLGVAVQDAILVTTSFQRHVAAGLETEPAAHAALEERLRPVLMTALVAMLGLTPAALSRGIGSETQKPLAIFVIGGAAMLLVASRLMQPALLVLFHRQRKPSATGEGEGAASKAAAEPPHTP